MNNKKGILILLVILVALIAAARAAYSYFGDGLSMDNLAAQEQTVSADETEEEVSYAAPDFTVYDGEGSEVRLSDFLGTPVVLNFWASWCGPCKMEMPDFQAKYEELDGAVQFLMINATDGGRETVDTAKAFIAESGYSFPVFYDTDYSAIYAYGVNAFPTTYFIDAEGNLAAYGQGAMSAETLQTGIDMIFVK